MDPSIRITLYFNVNIKTSILFQQYFTRLNRVNCPKTTHDIQLLMFLYKYSITTETIDVRNPFTFTIFLEIKQSTVFIT